MNFSAETVQNIILASIFLFFVAMTWLLAEFKGMKDEIQERVGINNEVIRLRLQALERFTLFAERSSLKNLVARIPSTGLSVVDLQLVFLDTLRSEYEYNVTQQIYVSPQMWKAISNLKDQHIFIINQLAATLPPNANGIELSKRILEYTASAQTELNAVVLSALQFEAQRIYKTEPVKKPSSR
jgi:hypothetical protein